MWGQQMIRQPWGITVFGSALVQATPDLAMLKFSVAQLANKPAEAFKATHEAAGRVRQRLDARRIPEGNVQTSRVGLDQSFEFAAGVRKFTGYLASVGYRVRVEQLDQVEPLLVELVEAGANRIESVEYLSSNLRELRREAREQAVHAARAKADIYATVAGVRVGPVMHIEDINPDTQNLARGGHQPGLDLSGQSDAVADALKPGSVTIAAAVAVGFGVQQI